MSNYTPGFYSITAPSIDRYLQLNGWTRNLDFANKNIMVYENYSTTVAKKLAIPAAEDYDDFYIVLRDILKVLSKVEKRSEIEIIKDINTTFIDRIEFRIISDISEDGKLPIDYAAACVQGLKDLVLYALCAEQFAQPICYRASDYAKSFLDKFKLAQTDKGSFILNIDIQVVDEGNEQSVLSGFEVPIPLEHKVVERIGTAINQVDEIVNNKRQLSETAESAYEAGITANMCDALMKMRPQSDTDHITTTIRYASALTNRTGLTERIDMRANHFLIIDELAKIYRDKIAVQDITLVGIVRSLSKRHDTDGEVKTIRLYTSVDGCSRTVSIDLSDDQYRIACDAHRDGLEVEVSGELDTSERYWTMSQITHFSLTSQDEPEE